MAVTCSWGGLSNRKAARPLRSISRCEMRQEASRQCCGYSDEYVKMELWTVWTFIAGDVVAAQDLMGTWGGLQLASLCPGNRRLGLRN